MARSQRRTALLYDAPISTPEDVALLKSMSLFFDDIAVFSTPAYRSHPPVIDPHLCAPLVERRLLQLLDPRDVTASHTEAIIRAALHRAVIEKEEHWLAAAAAGDWYIEVPRLQERFPVPSLVKTSESPSSRNPTSLGLFKLLAQEGLLFPDESTDDEWVLVRPGNASVANSILAQAVRATAGQQGRLIEPVATRRDEARVFSAILDDAVQNVGASDVVTSDLSDVTLDLCQVPLADILDFRVRHRNEFWAYVLALRSLLASPPSHQLADRTAALADAAHRLRELQRRRWTNHGGAVSLGVVGASWTPASGDLLGALIGGTAAGSPLLANGPTPVSAYTYILRPEPEHPDGSPVDGSPR